jgi:hypothetical protein
VRVYYLVPDYSEPSWGVGMLYAHVGILGRHGYDACAVHDRADFKPAWVEIDAPVVDGAGFQPAPEDVVVVPEVLIDDPRLDPVRCRRVVFVQGGFTLLARHAAAIGLRDRGFERAMAVLPNVAEIVAGMTALPVSVVPPFVAPYFFVDPADLSRPRPERLVVHAKPEIPDYQVALGLLRHAVGGRLEGLVPAQARQAVSTWRIVELEGLSHREVARTMAESSIFVNLNCYEAFNTTVSEAMAAGAVPVCYEAYGPRDYLVDGDNAIVFANNSLFPLVRTVVELMAAPGNDREARLRPIRRRAHATASRYDEASTERALIDFFQTLEGARDASA